MEKAKSPGSTQMSFWHCWSSRYDNKENAKNNVFVPACGACLLDACLMFLLGIVRGRVISSSAERWLRALHSFMFLLRKSTFNSHPVEGKTILKHLEKICSDHSEDSLELSIALSWKPLPTIAWRKLFFESWMAIMCVWFCLVQSGEHVPLVRAEVGSWRRDLIW